MKRNLLKIMLPVVALLGFGWFWLRAEAPDAVAQTNYSCQLVGDWVG